MSRQALNSKPAAREPKNGTLGVLRPSPCELSAPINPDRGVETQRNLFCGHYDACLDEAVKRAWSSWACVRCALFAMQPETEVGLEAYATQRRLA